MLALKTRRGRLRDPNALTTRHDTKVSVVAGEVQPRESNSTPGLDYIARVPFAVICVSDAGVSHILTPGHVVEDRERGWAGGEATVTLYQTTIDGAIPNQLMEDLS
jgi:hypothetical protein